MHVRLLVSIFFTCIRQVSELDGLFEDSDAAEKARERIIASPNIHYFIYQNTILVSCVELVNERYAGYRQQSLNGLSVVRLLTYLFVSCCCVNLPRGHTAAKTMRG